MVLIALSIFIGFIPVFEDFPGILLSLFYLAIFSILTILLFFLIRRILGSQGKSLKELILLYLEMIVLFGCLYFLLLLTGSTIAHFNGLSALTNEAVIQTPSLVITTFLKCLHFSVITVSTVGYGNIFPESWLALILTAIQIVLGLYIVIIGISSSLAIIVNKKIAKQEESRKLPLMLAAYEDISVFINRIMDLFVDIYKESGHENSPEKIEDLINEETFKGMYNNLNLDSSPSVTPSHTWWEYLSAEAKRICDYGEIILVRHASHVDPEIYNLVHKLTESHEFSTMKLLTDLKEINSKENIQPQMAANISSPSGEFLSKILDLYHWCDELRCIHSESRKNMRKLFHLKINN